MKVFCVLAISCLVGLAASAPQPIDSYYSEGSEYPIYNENVSQPGKYKPLVKFVDLFLDIVKGFVQFSLVPKPIDSHYSEGSEYPIYSENVSQPEKSSHPVVDEFIELVEDFLHLVRTLRVQAMRAFARAAQAKLDLAHANEVGIPNVNHASISPNAIGQVDDSKNPFLVPELPPVENAIQASASEHFVHHVVHPKVNANVVPKVVVSPPVIPDVPALVEADENGYRVINEEVVPIGQGPKVNNDGAASVATQVAGSSVSYEITKDDINIKSTGVEKESAVDV